MVCRLDYTAYAEDIEVQIEPLSTSLQLNVAIDCVERVVKLCEPLDPAKRCYFAFQYAKTEGCIASSKLKLLQAEVDSIQSLASDKINEIDYQEYMAAKQSGDQRVLDHYDELRQIDFAASAVSNLVGAILETNSEQFTSWCAWAIALAWAAKLGSTKEKEWQAAKVNSVLNAG